MIRTSDFKVMEYLATLSLVVPYSRCSSSNSCFMFSQKNALVPIKIRPKETFEYVKDKVNKKYETWTGKGEAKCHLPIKNAITLRKVYDLFIVVVRYTSLATKADPLVTCFRRYRALKNPNAKMVIVNMRKRNPGLKYSNQTNRENILELCHFDSYTPYIIRAFALNYFH